MTDLLTQLQNATEGSRRLSDDVLEVCGWHHCVDKRLPDRSQYGWLAPGDPPVLVTHDPDPTRNLQDAVSLLGDDWEWTLYSDGSVELGHTRSPGELMEAEFDGEGATPCLGICIAIIKAHESKAERAA